MLRALSEKVSARLKKPAPAHHRAEAQDAGFQDAHAQPQLSNPTRLATHFQTGLELLRKEADGTKYRLLGIGVSIFRMTTGPTRLISSTSIRANAPWPKVP